VLIFFLKPSASLSKTFVAFKEKKISQLKRELKETEDEKLALDGKVFQMSEDQKKRISALKLQLKELASQKVILQGDFQKSSQALSLKESEGVELKSKVTSLEYSLSQEIFFFRP
jgi:predicted  nucleic acid-binding Zn-ribbon protein